MKTIDEWDLYCIDNDKSLLIRRGQLRGILSNAQ